MSQYDLDITVESKARMEGSWGATGWTTVELNITAHANMDTCEDGLKSTTPNRRE